MFVADGIAHVNPGAVFAPSPKEDTDTWSRFLVILGAPLFDSIVHSVPFAQNISGFASLGSIGYIAHVP